MTTTTEHDGDVTSMALPTKALREVQRIWETGDDDLLRDNVIGLVRDLFDGSDGHLHAIDAVLGPRG